MGKGVKALPMLQLDCVAFDPVLAPVTISFEPGRLVGVIGPNGAGKSTLLKTIAGLLAATSGRVLVDHVDLRTVSSKLRAQKLAYLPQTLAEDIPYTVREFVEMGRFSHQSMWSEVPKTGKARVEDALAEMGLTTFADRPMYQVSGGERQRAGIARCLAQESPILLLDEPISNLDIFYQLDIMGKLSELAARGHLLLVAIHHLEFALRFCDDLLVLTNGKLVAFGPVEDVFTEDLIHEVFGIDAAMFTDPIRHYPRLSVALSEQKHGPGKAARV
jgi:iron complex transport system ATP-binding protein